MVSTGLRYESMSSELTKVDTNTETRICAMIARGDKHQQIVDQLASEDITIALSTISAIKKRNTEAIAFMKNQMIEAEASTATRLIHKSRMLLEKRLDQGIKDEDELNKLATQYREGEINWEQYRIKAAGRLKLSISELTSLSKEAFHQSQLEQGKPTGIVDDPAAAKMRLKEVLMAINNRDDEKAVALIFDNVKS